MCRSSRIGLISTAQPNKLWMRKFNLMKMKIYIVWFGLAYNWPKGSAHSTAQDCAAHWLHMYHHRPPCMHAICIKCSLTYHMWKCIMCALLTDGTLHVLHRPESTSWGPIVLELLCDATSDRKYRRSAVPSLVAFCVASAALGDPLQAAAIRTYVPTT